MLAHCLQRPASTPLRSMLPARASRPNVSATYGSLPSNGPISAMPLTHTVAVVRPAILRSSQRMALYASKLAAQVTDRPRPFG